LRITVERSTLREVARFIRFPEVLLVGPVFSSRTAGIPTVMYDSEDLPDDVPVADAVEQQRKTSESVLDEEATAEPPREAPLEVAGADWQEQLETVELDPEFDEVDRP
jgi:hypothetical protein